MQRLKSVDINDTEAYAVYEYTKLITNGSKVKTTMKDGTVYTVTKDCFGRITESAVDAVKVTNTYNADGRLTKKVSGGKITTYSYNTDGTVSQINKPSGHMELYEYNSDRKLWMKDILGPVNQSYFYEYKEDSKKSLAATTANGNTSRPKVDALGRNIGRSISNSVGTKIFVEKIGYIKHGDHATHMPESVSYTKKVGNELAYSEKLTYRYDSMGNITQVLENGRTICRYEYDALGRLIREDNRAFGATYRYVYDNSGNIIAKHEHLLTYTPTKDLELTTSTQTFYTYEENGDKLLSYAGTPITYNVMGAPTSYRGKGLTWNHGTQLASFAGVSFTYDAEGKRTAKGTVNYSYDSNGNLIYSSNGMSFLYDHTGIFAMEYNGSTYFYRKNTQNDIIAILDNNGNPVVKYVYDAWGNHKVLTGLGLVIDEEETPDHIGFLNPFRYRSYYFDTETGLYYLKARYYDPEVGRFISPDEISYFDPDNVNGLNLYAYCNNNPVMYCDPEGHSLLAALLIGALIGVAIGFAGTALVDYSDDGQIFNGSISAEGYLLNTAVGGLIGALIGGATSFSAPVLKTFLQSILPSKVILAGSGGAISVSVSKSLIAIGVGILFFKDPYIKSLEKGMTQNQKEKFQREIEDYKRSEGRGGADNLTKDILRKIAEYVIKAFK